MIRHSGDEIPEKPGSAKKHTQTERQTDTQRERERERGSKTVTVAVAGEDVRDTYQP